MTELGAIVLPQIPTERLFGVAEAAEAAGLERLYLWEDCFWGGGLTTAAAVLARTTRLGVGVGLLPVPLRNVAITAMELAQLERLFPGRARIGVGHGVQDWMGQVGARVESPMTLLREYLSALRALLRGESLNIEGRYVQLDRVALDLPPERAPAILAGATGPRTLRLSGELADGTILTGNTSPGALREARRLIEQGRAEGGRTDPHLVTVYLLTTTGPDAAERLDRERDRLGRPGIGVAGDAEAVAVTVRAFAEAGADEVVLQPALDEPDPAVFARFVAEQVRPLVPA